MSVYTIRYIEGKFSNIAGTKNSIKDLPDDASEGAVYRVWNADFKYYKKTGSEWVGQDTCETYWKLLAPIKKLDRLPERAKYEVLDPSTFEPTGEYKYYEPENPNIEIIKKDDGSELYLKKCPYFYNNGGAIRDEYIRNRWNDNFPYKDRGFPDDMCDETRKSMTDDDGEFCKYGYNKTYVTLSEWYSFYEKEKARILGKIKDSYEKKFHNEINAKLDFLINNMKSPVEADVNTFFSNLNKNDNDNDDDYYDSAECIIEENMINLYQIAEEIGKIEYVADMYELWGCSNDVRVIYYLEH